MTSSYRLVCNVLLSATAVLALAAASPALAKKKPQQTAPAAEKAAPAPTGVFIFDEKVNAEMAKKLNIPVHFALPASARAPLPPKIDTKDKLIDFKHPDAKGVGGDVGLRLVVSKRSGLADRLGKSGLVQTGDILLTFRSEWGGAGAYPNIQMGVSHAGIAYIKNGSVRHLDNPLSAEYLGSGLKGDLTSEHYRTLNFIHVIRPRNLTDLQKAQLVSWATLVQANASSIYPKQLSFNSDYNAPKYAPGRPLDFVRQLGQMALKQSTPGNISMFCSEFAWSLLSLRDCDPAKTADQFKGSSVPSCVHEAMKPMEATGNYMTTHGRYSYSGLADGPLMVIDAMKLPLPDRTNRLAAVFTEKPDGLAKLSSGHRAVATEMKPKFEPLQKYYLGVSGGGLLHSIKARMIAKAFRLAVPENYSPTSFIVNTLLPPDNANRSMDYVATIVLE